MASTDVKEHIAVREVTLSPLGYANPVPIGLLAFGMTTALLSLSNAGLFAVGTMILAMAVFFGGLAQVLAALMSFRRNDTFALTAFGGYGFLWITLAFTLIGQQHGWWPAANSSIAMGWYLFVFAIFGTGVTLASLPHPRALTLVLALTAALVLILAIGEWTGNATIMKIAGWEGVVTGASAVYLAFAHLVNDSFGRTLVPIGRPLAGSGR